MVDYADTHAVFGSPVAGARTLVAALGLPNVLDVNTPIEVWAEFVIAPGADTTSLLVELDNGTTNATFASAGIGAVEATDADFGIPVALSGGEAPGQAGQVSYALYVTVNDASAPSPVLSLGLHARYNYAPQVAAIV